MIYFIIFPEFTNSIYQVIGQYTAEVSTVTEYSDVIFQVILFHVNFLFEFVAAMSIILLIIFGLYLTTLIG